MSLVIKSFCCRTVGIKSLARQTDTVLFQGLTDQQLRLRLQTEEIPTRRKWRQVCSLTKFCGFVNKARRTKITHAVSSTDYVSIVVLLVLVKAWNFATFCSVPPQVGFGPSAKQGLQPAPWAPAVT